MTTAAYCLSSIDIRVTKIWNGISQTTEYELTVWKTIEAIRGMCE